VSTIPKGFRDIISMVSLALLLPMHGILSFVLTQSIAAAAEGIVEAQVQLGTIVRTVNVMVKILKSA